MPPLEQRKKSGFCKYHGFFGHKTSACVLFRDLVQKSLDDGRLKFGKKAKPQMKIESHPLQVADSLYTEPCLVAKVLANAVESLTVDANVAVMECKNEEAV